MLQKSIKNGYRKKLELILLISIILSTIIYSCKKTEIIAEPEQKVNFSEKFFALKGGESSLVLDIVKNLKVQNERTHFVDNLPADCGLPMWNKLNLIANKNKHNDVTARGVSSTANTQGTPDTVYIIPLTITNTAISSLLTLVPDTGNSYIINCLTTNMYLYNLCHGTIANQSFTENQLAMFFSMEYETFGRTQFYNIPSNIFSHQGNPSGTRTVSIDTVLVGNYIQSTCIILTHCTQDGDCVSGICDQCNWCVEPLCWTYGEPGNGGGGNSGGSGSSGSGPGGSGGSGGGTTNNNGCPWYGCGPPPPPPQIYSTNCDSFVTKLETNLTFTNYMKYLNTKGPGGILSLSYEVGFEVKDVTINSTNTYIINQGIPDKASINWNLPANSLSEGFMHSHYGGLNNIFTPEDIIFMAQVFVTGHAKDTNNLFFSVTSTMGLPLLMKVGNTAAFRTFCEKIVGVNGNDESKMQTFADRFYDKINSSNPDTNMQEFLKIIKGYGNNAENGLTIYLGNEDCNSWKQQKLNSVGTISTVICVTIEP